MATVNTFWSLADHLTDHMLIADIKPDLKMSQKVKKVFKKSKPKKEPVAAMAMRVSAQRLLRSPGPLLVPSGHTKKDKMDGVSLKSRTG